MKRLFFYAGVFLVCLCVIAVLGCKEPVVYTVTYDGNGQTGGSPPVDEETYEAGERVTVLGDTGNLEKTYHNFGGWNTAADGSGTGYRTGTTFDIGSSNVTLYADWYYTLRLWATGQTTSYETGDDGDVRAGAAWPEPRFYDNGDGTITDNLTGLVWQQDGDASGPRTWEQALSYCSGLDLAGHDDWRLPNRKEMLSLINFSKSFTSTWLNDSGFTGIRNDFYWTSNVDPCCTSDACYIDMTDTDFINYQAGTLSSYVLAVRGEANGKVHLPKTGQTTSYAAGDDGEVQAGVEWPDPRFTDNGDGTITDHITKLMWQQDAGAIGLQTWADAVSACNSLTVADYDDWRLPNVLELESLLNYGEVDQETYLSSKGFVNLPPCTFYFWTSTQSAYDPTSALWYVDFNDGLVKSSDSDRCVLAVRSVE